MSYLKPTFIFVCTFVLFSTSNSSVTTTANSQPSLSHILPQESTSINTQQIKSGKIPEGLSKPEWQSIQAQIKLGKYKVYANDNSGYQSSNPANGWQIEYASDGTTTLNPYNKSDEDYQISLRLNSVSYESSRSAKSNEFDMPENINFANERLNYHWNDNITEYWINSEQKLEQWFEIIQRPFNHQNIQQGPLQIQMTLDTDLEVSLKDNSLNIGTITYDQLKVWDVNGQIITARLDLQGKELTILIDDGNANYPLTIDPSFAQGAYLKASNTDVDDEFGDSVSISGNTLVIGAAREDSNAIGVNGNQSDNSTALSGAAYVFVRTESIWIQQAYLKASNTDEFDAFGSSVSISGDTLVVGAKREASNATGVNGDQNNNLTGNSGAAYVFVRIGTTWAQQAYLKASNTGGSALIGDLFGNSISISGDTLVIGATGEGSNATGVNGDQTNNSAVSSGAVYVFVRSGTIWAQEAYLKASNTNTSDFFGGSISISADTLVVGAGGEGSNATGVNGNQGDNSAFNAGAAYVFIRTGTTWTQQAYLKASNTNMTDGFGNSVSISGNTLVIGAQNEDSNATGVNGNQSDNSFENAGAAYVFVRTGITWVQQAYLKASNTDADDYFGVSVSISDNTLVIGASGEGSNATGVNGNQSNNSMDFSGAVYVFIRTGTTWDQQAYLKASNTNTSDSFGWSVSISGGTLVIGAPLEDSNATGVNVNQSDNSADGSGAAYIFDVGYSIGGTVTGLTVGNTLILQNKFNDDLTINTNGPFAFDTALFHLSSYTVTVLTQPTNPNQVCEVIDGSGMVVGEDVTDILVECNTEPTTVLDFNATTEDTILNAMDSDGTATTNPNDNSVLVNDTDVESDSLYIVNHGTFIAGGIGGSITLNFDGTYSYTPPADEFGNATLDYQVSDGLSTVDAHLVINVLSVNDAPSFSIAGDIEEDLYYLSTSPLDVFDFITGFDLGPDNESNQQISQYNVVVQSDSNAVLNGISVNNTGVLSIDFTNNVGVALIDISLQDDGGTDFGGQDTSVVQSFYIAFNNNIIFINGFEASDEMLILTYFIQVQTATLSLDYPVYDTELDAIDFYGELFYLNGDYQSTSKLETFENWLKEVLIYKAPYGDYDNDGIENYLDSQPFKVPLNNREFLSKS